MDIKTYVGVLVKWNNKVLLCKRNIFGSLPGMWSVPAGKVEKGETQKLAAIREFFEETNVDISDRKLELLGIIPRASRDGKKVKGQMYLYYFETKRPIKVDLVGAVDGEEHTDWGYFSIDEIKVENVGNHLYQFIDFILK